MLRLTSKAQKKNIFFAIKTEFFQLEDNGLCRTTMVDYTASAYLRNWKMALLIFLRKYENIYFAVGDLQSAKALLRHFPT